MSLLLLPGGFLLAVQPLQLLYKPCITEQLNRPTVCLLRAPLPACFSLLLLCLLLPVTFYAHTHVRMVPPRGAGLPCLRGPHDPAQEQRRGAAGSAARDRAQASRQQQQWPVKHPRQCGLHSDPEQDDDLQPAYCCPCTHCVREPTRVLPCGRQGGVRLVAGVPRRSGGGRAHQADRHCQRHLVSVVLCGVSCCGRLEAKLLWLHVRRWWLHFLS